MLDRGGFRVVCGRRLAGISVHAPKIVEAAAESNGALDRGSAGGAEEAIEPASTLSGPFPAPDFTPYNRPAVPGRSRTPLPRLERSMREYPSQPLVGVGAVVWRGDEVLLVRRRHPPRRDRWSLPGGLQKLGETLFEAARREVREETGVDIRVLGVADVVDLIERDGAGGRIRYHYTLVDVVAVWLAGEAAAATDADDAAWTDVAGLPRFRLWSETERVILLARRKLPDLLSP